MKNFNTEEEIRVRSYIENIIHDYLKNHLKIKVGVSGNVAVRVEAYLDDKKICEDADYQ